MERYRLFLSFLSLAAALCALPPPAHATITLHYYERPPYLVRQADGSARGLTADPARMAFAKAGVPYRWSMTPAKRQLSLLEYNSGKDCGIGWFRNPQREQFAQFSLPLYRDLPPVAIVRRDKKIADKLSVAEVLSDPRLRVLLKDGLTYGSYVAENVALSTARIEKVTIEQPQLVRMIAAGRADLMFATGEEAALLVTQDESGENALRVLSFPDMPPGEFRYLMCSRQVPAETLQQLNAVLKTLPVF